MGLPEDPSGHVPKSCHYKEIQDRKDVERNPTGLHAHSFGASFASSAAFIDLHAFACPIQPWPRCRISPQREHFQCSPRAVRVPTVATVRCLGLAAPFHSPRSYTPSTFGFWSSAKPA